MPDPTVGVDISKTHLDAYRAPDGTAARFTNDDAGFKALIAWIERPVRAVTYEPTGHWHRAFEEALLSAGLPLARVNPLQARRFAQAIGQRAKTDLVDARVLAQMGAALELRPTEMSSPARRALEELQVARDALIRDRTAALNRQKQIRHRLLKRQNKAQVAQLDRHLAAIDAEIGKRLAEDEALARRAEKHYGCPQDVEWAIDRHLPTGENVLMLQSRPETVWSQKQRQPLKRGGTDPMASIVSTLVSPLHKKSDT